ncbi:MAG: hypothetical protein ACQKBU_00195, partial [Verrucomicrobiales bacterium]
MKTTTALIPTLAALTLFSCENPADSTTTATVAEAKGNETSLELTAAPTHALSDSSTLSFVGSKVTGSHEGGFKNIDGTITINGEGNLTS